MYKWGVLVLAILLFVAYAGVSYFIASGVTRAELVKFEDHPTDYGLEYEDVEFVSRKGDVTLMGWYLSSPGCEASVIFVHGSVRIAQAARPRGSPLTWLRNASTFCSLT